MVSKVRILIRYNSYLFSEPTTANTTMYHSILDESEIISGTESRVTNSLMTEDNSMEVNSPIKRKRSRRKKVKRLSSEIASMKQNSCQEVPKKPKIIASVLIASGKHIRFNGPDEAIVSPVNFSSPKRFCDNPGATNTPSKDLHTLLALKQCSTPLSFSYKKPEKEIKVEKTSQSLAREDEENITESARNIVMPNEIKKKENSDLQIEDIDPENYPLSTTLPKVYAVIAFKVNFIKFVHVKCKCFKIIFAK